MRYIYYVLFLLLLSATPLYAQVTGLSYTFAPIGSRVNFDVNAGISSSYAYGGAIGLGFGEYLELSAEYTMSDGAKIDFSRYATTDAVRATLVARDGTPVQVDRMGLNMRLNLGRNYLLPFVQASTGDRKSVV